MGTKYEPKTGTKYEPKMGTKYEPKMGTENHEKNSFSYAIGHPGLVPHLSNGNVVPDSNGAMLRPPPFPESQHEVPPSVLSD